MEETRMATTISSPVMPGMATDAAQAQEGNPRLRGLFARVERQPLLAAVLIWIADLLLNVGVTLGAQTWLPGFQPDFIALCLVAAATAVAVGALGWWRVIGFNRPTEWRHLRVLVLPALAMVIFPFVAGIQLLDTGTTLYFIVAYALVAFHEEAIHRGILL